MKKKLIKLFLLVGFFAQAQNFTHSLAISAQKNGLQALALDAELRNVSNTLLSDVRLYDSKTNEVPFFLVNESFNYFSGNFKEYVVIDKEVGEGRYTRLTVSNPKKDTIQNIVLCVSNSDAWKICDITGSDDNKQWFSVSDRIFMHHLYDEKNVLAYRTLYFPAVNYKFIKIEINDLRTKPLNILKAGYFEGSISAGKLNQLKEKSLLNNTDKIKKKSVLAISFENPAIIDNIIFKVKAPNLFKRKAGIYVERKRTVKKKEETYHEMLLEFELNSETANSFDLSNFREKDFFIEIDNQDNPPLEFEAIEFKQLQSYLVADFKAGENYILMAGNKKLSKPNYDIENFRKKITQYMPTLKVGALGKMPEPVVDETKIVAKKMWEEPWFMWACIAIGSLILFVFSAKILKDMKK